MHAYTVLAFTARSFADRPLDSVTIEMSQPFPDGDMPTAVIGDTMQTDAVNIVTALHNTLPQGTWARVVAEVARQWSNYQQGLLVASNWNVPKPEPAA